MLYRTLSVTLLGLLSVLLTACITSQMLGDKFYREKVSTYLLSEDGRALVVVGNQYHYVLELNNQVSAVLKAPYRNLIDLRLPQVSVARDNSTKAAYTLILPKTASDQDKHDALEAGFRADKYWGVLATGELLGRRYEKIDLPADYVAGKFNRTHEVLITEERQTSERIVGTALSPVTAGADGLLFLFGIPLFAAHILVNAHK